MDGAISSKRFRPTVVVLGLRGAISATVLSPPTPAVYLQSCAASRFPKDGACLQGWSQPIRNYSRPQSPCSPKNQAEATEKLYLQDKQLREGLEKREGTEGSRQSRPQPRPAARPDVACNMEGRGDCLEPGSGYKPGNKGPEPRAHLQERLHLFPDMPSHAFQVPNLADNSHGEGSSQVSPTLTPFQGPPWSRTLLKGPWSPPAPTMRLSPCQCANADHVYFCSADLIFFLATMGQCSAWADLQLPSRPQPSLAVMHRDPAMRQEVSDRNSRVCCLARGRTASDFHKDRSLNSSYPSAPQPLFPPPAQVLISLKFFPWSALMTLIYLICERVE